LAINPKLYKRSSLEFTKNFTLFKTRCVICVKDKKDKRHCKIFPNLPSAWQHLQKYHSDDSDLRHMIDDIIDLYNVFHKAIQWNILPGIEHSGYLATTSSRTLNSRPTKHRKVLDNLVDIADTMGMHQYFPYFNKKQLKDFVHIALGDVDPRTQQKYLDCIIKSSIKNMHDGTYNIRKFFDCTR